MTASSGKLFKVEVERDGSILGRVSVSVMKPKRYEAAAVVAHGAGGNMQSPLLCNLQSYLADRSVAAVRFNFLYTESKRRAPDRRVVLEAACKSVADWVWSELQPGKLFLGGKSMGGRMASYLAAEGYRCEGLFFLGYPLHPPGKPDQLRKEHLGRIPVPMLFVSGTRDALCRLNLLHPIVNELGPRVTLHVVEGGDHSFNTPKSLKREKSEVEREILETVDGWMESVSR